jgi:hypothetical protein
MESSSLIKRHCGEGRNPPATHRNQTAWRDTSDSNPVDTGIRRYDRAAKVGKFTVPQQMA